MFAMKIKWKKLRWMDYTVLIIQSVNLIKSHVAGRGRVD